MPITSIQDPAELDQFIAFLRERRVRSYLEIGLALGGTFEKVVLGLPDCHRAVGIDLRPSTELYDVLSRLGRAKPHCKTRFIWGPSCEWNTVQSALADGPYDAVLIDADHRLEGVTADWEIYRRSAKYIAFHDIAKQPGWKDREGIPIEVPKLWAELKAEHKTTEIISPGSFMGIGVVECQLSR
jgi:hypothetical protein